MQTACGIGASLDHAEVLYGLKRRANGLLPGQTGLYSAAQILSGRQDMLLHVLANATRQGLLDSRSCQPATSPKLVG